MSRRSAQDELGFGSFVALAQDDTLNLLLIGSGFEPGGAIHVYEYDSADRNLRFLQTIQSPPGQHGDLFGRGLMTIRDPMKRLLFVTGIPGSDRARTNGGGAAIYAFDPSSRSWALDAELYSQDAQSYLNGYSVSAQIWDGDLFVALCSIIAYSGRGGCTVFTQRGENWIELQPIPGTADEDFGRSVALAGDHVLVGAAAAEVDSKDRSGIVRLFPLDRPVSTAERPTETCSISIVNPVAGKMLRVVHRGNSTPSATIEVFNALGRHVLSTQRRLASGINSVPLTLLSPGVYVARIHSADCIANELVTYISE